LDLNLNWCQNCNIPLVGNKCSLCGSTGKKVSSDLRPVFLAEKAMLQSNIERELPWPLFYGSRGWFYSSGKTIGRMSYDSEGVPTIKLSKSYNGITSNSQQMTETEFITLTLNANLESLITREQEAIDFILGVVKENPGVQPVVAFSGGKDSTIVAELVRRALGSATLFFADTTIEFPDTYDYLETIRNTEGYTLITEAPESTFYELNSRLGPPSQRMRWCCTVCKAGPLNSYLNRQQDYSLFFDGIRRHESQARKDYERISGNKKAVKQIVARPILEWSTMDVWLYIWWRQLKYNQLYTKGYGRAGCMHCPYNTRYDNYLTKLNFPTQHKYWHGILEKYFEKENSDLTVPKEQKDFWLDYGWKHRLPHRRRKYVGGVRSWSPDRNYIELDNPIVPSMADFLVPIGQLFFHDEKEFSLSVEDSVIKAKIGTNLIRVKGPIPKKIVKALNKYLNCVGCGGCKGSCPNSAISIKNDKVTVNVEKCNHCGYCLGTKLGCVGLTYKSVSNAILAEAEKQPSQEVSLCLQQ